MIEQKTPLYRDEDHEFLGFIVKDATSWLATTIFGYTIARVAIREDAEKALYEQGLEYLKGVWQYFDKDEQQWFPCVIKDAMPLKVIVNRTNDLGYIESDSFKQVQLDNPTDTTLIKAS